MRHPARRLLARALAGGVATSLTLTLAGLLVAAPETGRITGRVRVLESAQPKAGAAGGDALEVVVYVAGYSEPAPPGVIAEIRQKDRHFHPALLAITAGQEVSFPNLDTIIHSVYSVSSPRKFDLGYYPGGETRKQLFPTQGVVDVYCLLHPEMAATILVLPNRRFTNMAADGTYAIDGVRAGKWSVFAYHRRAVRPARREVEVVVGGSVESNLEIPGLDEVLRSAPK